MANTDPKPAAHAGMYRFIKWLIGITFLFFALLFLPKYPIASFWFVIFGLILLPPSARLIARKTKHDIPRWLNVTVAVVGLFGMIGVAGQDVEKRTPAGTDNSAPVQARQDAPPTPISEEDQLKQIVADQLKGNNNMSKASLRSVNVVQQVDGGWGVFTEFNADDNLTMNMRRGGIESDMGEIYIALYTSGKDVRTASVAAYFPLVDKYGNGSDGMVYKTTLNKAEADKVNWSADGVTLRRSILPAVWTATLVHPEFR